LTDLDITRLFIVECPKCQKAVWLLSYGSYDEKAIHYCTRCDYTFATGLRGEFLGHKELAERYLQKYTHEKFYSQPAQLISNWSNYQGTFEDK
jgi:hypothetical protein